MVWVGFGQFWVSYGLCWSVWVVLVGLGHLGLVRVNSVQIRFVCKSSSQFGPWFGLLLG